MQRQQQGVSGPGAGDCSRRSRLEGLGAATKSGDGRGATDAPVLVLVGIEPYESEQPVSVGYQQKVGYLRWLGRA